MRVRVRVRVRVRLRVQEIEHFIFLHTYGLGELAASRKKVLCTGKGAHERRPEINGTGNGKKIIQKKYNFFYLFASDTINALSYFAIAPDC